MNEFLKIYEPSMPESSYNYDEMSKYMLHPGTRRGENVQNVKFGSLSDVELSYCHFCYSLINACFNINAKDSDGVERHVTHLKDKNIQEEEFRKMLSSLRKEIFGWLDGKTYDIPSKITIPERDKKLYNKELGGYYDNVVDFLLMGYGLKRKDPYSTVTSREDGGESCGEFELEAITPFDRIELELKEHIRTVDELDRIAKLDKEQTL